MDARSGNKLIGVQILQSYLSAEPGRTLHVGDQVGRGWVGDGHFLSTGNDFATRAQCCTLWIINPAETQQVLLELGHLLEAFRGRPGEASSDGTVAPPATTSHTLLEGVQGEEGELTVPE
ncbi:hypothetical protein BC936DRAFT_148357 [Jimgerdemannia flammicorona]|uniref:IMP-specific 5'-nucleotidase 1 n=1 Tax=Jimgerdemannia flammicorona TaxID=994334 RepID=A0A433D392_9FUNG|nr:hypothetical protein BC936DRAFT_148357 [Jimgerdemannia flammicorona]